MLGLCLLFIHPPAHGSEVSPAARNTLDSARIPRASKLLICGLFQKVRVLAQDGVHIGGTRRRRTTVIAYTGEEEVAQIQVRVPASPRSIDAQNLRDPRHDLIGQLEKLVREHRVSFGRFDVSLPVEERNAGLTVNEYETLLMMHDLQDVLRNPLRGAARQGGAPGAPRVVSKNTNALPSP